MGFVLLKFRLTSLDIRSSKYDFLESRPLL